MSIAHAHILIVDDDIRILELLKKFLQKNGYLVTTAISVQEAEKVLKLNIFDLIILDVMLPEITGIEFARMIKSYSPNQDDGQELRNDKAPIVMLTALSSPADKIMAMEAGANDYMTKPFEPEELLLRIKNLIHNSKSI